MKISARLLIVDDEANIRHFLVRILEREGYIVQSASDGVAALQILAAEPIDLLLMDIRMNHLNGIALLEETKSRYPHMAVVLLTGHVTVDTAVAALRHKAANYLLKPVKNEEIITAVAMALQARHREQRRDQLEQVAAQFSQVLSGDVTLSTEPTARLECGDLVLHPAR